MTTTIPRPDPGSFFIREARWADMTTVGHIYASAFTGPGAKGDNFVELLFPNSVNDKSRLAQFVSQIFAIRYYSPLKYTFKILDDGTGRAVGFTCIMPPKDNTSFIRRWFSPYLWYCYAARNVLSLYQRLFCPQNPDADSTGAYIRVMGKFEPQILNSDRRRNAWHLSTLAVYSHLQGLGLGKLLMNDALQLFDAQGEAAWLVGLSGTAPFYNKFGFKLIERINVGELKSWNGGLAMFRE